MKKAYSNEMKWNDAKEVVPNDERMVLCRGERGAYYMAKYKDGYYWNRSMIRGGDCEPIEWMDIPEVEKTMDVCGDNRFELIAKAKKQLLEATNIETSPKEMEVLDNFLFRCWQMGWLDKIKTKEIKYFDEDEKVWKIGKVIIND